MDSKKSLQLKANQNNLEPITFFKKDDDFVFVYKKTEKLATALYMITNLFSEYEPMKWNLRKKGSDLLSFMLGYKDASSQNFIEETKSRILELTSLLEIVSKSGLVSVMNFSILKEEFSNLIFSLTNSLCEQKISLKDSHIKALFDDTSSHYSLINRSTSKLEESFSSKTDRQNTILNLVRTEKELTIKGISQIIKDCSEKTIQRELISLISQGLLKRTGQKRWSRYSLT